VWYVYILANDAADRLYTGVSPDPVHRLDQHNGKCAGGAKATRAGRPWRIVFTEEHRSRGLALKRERAIKKMTRSKKLALVS
jgi:putative endonuclease